MGEDRIEPPLLFLSAGVRQVVRSKRVVTPSIKDSDSDGSGVKQPSVLSVSPVTLDVESRGASTRRVFF